MIFHVVSSFPSAAREQVYLLRDNWNDWFEYETTFTVFAFTNDGTRIDLGHVKIGQFNMVEGQRSPELPSTFERLDERFFSIGQSDNYYESINTLGEFREQILQGLRDCAYDLSIFEASSNEDVMNSSLLRSVSEEKVKGRFHRLAHGNAILTAYSFVYQLPASEDAITPPPELHFSVTPDSSPPSNVHVIIGRNGVGKTRCLTFMTHALLNIPLSEGEATGTIRQDVPDDTFGNSRSESVASFSNIVSVSFSAFDAFVPLSPDQAIQHGMRYTYVGLKKPRQENTSTLPPLKSFDDLCAEFVNGVTNCRQGLRLERWHRALQMLESDPLFLEANVSSLSNTSPFDDSWREQAYRLFRKLSSGHGVILLTITRLIELVDEQTLVLLDEPEGHLHPPLLSAFVRALSDLLIQRNGVAIIATHSPVVLQEVPSTCAWFLSRSGAEVRADRPDIETFGENVGVLTREVFGLEVIQSGFHGLIARAVEDFNGDYERVLSHFENRLGAEGRAIARALAVARTNTE